MSKQEPTLITFHNECEGGVGATTEGKGASKRPAPVSPAAPPQALITAFSIPSLQS